MQIDRKGRVVSSKFLKKTGNALLDAIAFIIIEKANPMPPPPEDYQGGEALQFDIPIRFVLDGR